MTGENVAVIILIIGIGVLVLALVFRRGGTGLVQLSHLKCPKCTNEFDYAWIPGASITSFRLGGSRLFGCPICHKWSMFDIWNTRVDPETHHCEMRIGPN